MEIKELFIKNFVKVKEIYVNIKPGVTLLVGENGSSKTVVGLDAIWFALKGLAQKGKDVLHGERFRFIGPWGKSSQVKLTLYDEKEDVDIFLERKLTKDSAPLKITASDGRALKESFVDDIFSIFSINPWGFVNLSAKEQALALGINTDEFDEKRKVLYEERTEINREVKRLQNVVDTAGTPEKAERVDVQALMSELSKIETENKISEQMWHEEKNQAFKEVLEFNQEQDKAAQDLASANKRIDLKKEQLKALKSEILTLEGEIKSLPLPAKPKNNVIAISPPVLVDTKPISDQIAAATETNEKAMAYKRYIKNIEALNKEKANSENKSFAIEACDVEKAEYVKAQKLPFSNMSIDEEGGLLVEGRPFAPNYWSKGEIGRMVPRLIASQKPDLRFMFVPDSQSIDSKNRETLFKGLADQGFQVLAEFVGTEKPKDHNAILLKEGEVVESYEEDKGQKGLL